MAYVVPTPRSSIVPVAVKDARQQFINFCAAAFPGTRVSSNVYNNRVSVSLTIAEGAYASVVFDARELTAGERASLVSPTNARIEVTGTMSGVAVLGDANGRAAVQAFFDDVSKAVTTALTEFGETGHMRARPHRMIWMPPPQHDGIE